MITLLTKKEICQKLRKRCWKRTNWTWYNFSHPVGKKGVTLREAASFEGLTSSEDLTEHPVKNENRKVRVSYTVTLKPHEFDGIVALAREWGLDHAKTSTPLYLVQRALQNSGTSGCLADIPTEAPEAKQ